MENLWLFFLLLMLLAMCFPIRFFLLSTQIRKQKTSSPLTLTTHTLYLGAASFGTLICFFMFLIYAYGTDNSNSNGGDDYFRNGYHNHINQFNAKLILGICGVMFLSCLIVDFYVVTSSKNIGKKLFFSMLPFAVLFISMFFSTGLSRSNSWIGFLILFSFLMFFVVFTSRDNKSEILFFKSVVFNSNSKSHNLSANEYYEYMKNFMEIQNEIYVIKGLSYLLKNNVSEASDYFLGLDENDKDAKNYLLSIVYLIEKKNLDAIRLLEEINDGVGKEFGDFFYLLSKAYETYDNNKSVHYESMYDINILYLFHDRDINAFIISP